MDNALFERLLYEEEGPTVDFKRAQYRFAKASEVEKSELLKDILGMVNAWRRSEGFILIGVEEVRGGRSSVFGIQANEHLDDHSLQQFVNNLTNRSVRFRYEAFGFEGKQVGIIRVEEQPRPVYLKQDYGKLKKEWVYVRRGSSTDPTKPATPDEIAQMGVVPVEQEVELVVEFADSERDAALGGKLILDSEFCEMPKAREIPDLARPRVRNALGIDLSAIELDPFNRLNADYFREQATFEFCRRLYRPIRLLVSNVGPVSARKVRLELEVPKGIGVHIAYPWDLPEPPKRRTGPLVSQAMRHIPTAFNRSPGDAVIDTNDERYRIGIECGDLQPGRRVWSDVLSVGKGETGDVELVGRILAENLTQPKDVALTLSVNVTRSSCTVDELLRLSDSVVEDENEEDE